MILSDADLLARLGHTDERKRLMVWPMKDPEKQIQPASIDVRLGNRFLVYQEHPDINDAAVCSEVWADDGETIFLSPGAFVLATTKEQVRVPHDLVGRVEGKSTIGRMGIIVHATAGFVDPGFGPAEITLEMSCIFPAPQPVYPGMYIAQLAFQQMLTPCLRPYGKERGSHYQGQRGPTPAWTMR